MANLETLELTINGSAKSASAGIDVLIRSLSSLSSALVKPYSDLRDFNEELRKMKGYCNSIKLPNIAKYTGAKSAVAKVKKAAGEYDPLRNNNRIAKNMGDPMAKSDAQWQKEYEANVAAMKKEHDERRKFNATRRKEIEAQAETEKAAQERLAAVKEQAYKASYNAERAAMLQRGEDTQAIMEQSSKLDLLRLKQEALHMETVSMAKEGKLTTKQIAERSLQYQKLGDQIEKLKEQMAKTKQESNGVNQTVENIKKIEPAMKKATSSAKGLMKQIGRIAKTMLIRTAIRALMKAAKEGLDNFYKYSKAIGSTYYKELDSVASKWGQIKNQIGAALGTALSAVLPVLKAIASVALTAVNMITALFALLSGKNTYSQAQESMDSYTESAKGAAKATKDVLASFDELNVVQNNSGSSGGGAGTNYKDMFKEVELPAWMQEWKPIIEAILGGVLGAVILPKIFDWISKIFGLFGGKNLLNALDIFKRMKGLEDLDLEDTSDAVKDILDKFADSDILDGVSDIADLLNVVKNFDWKKLLVENIPGLIKLAIELLTKLIQGMDTTSKIKVDRKEFDQFKKDFDAFKDDNKTVSIGIKFSEDMLYVFTMGKNAIDKWVKEFKTKSVGIQFSSDLLYVFTMAKNAIDKWVTNEPMKTIGVKFNESLIYVFTMAKNAIDVWVKQNDTKVIGIRFNEVQYASVLLQMAVINAWVSNPETKKLSVQMDPISYGVFAATMAAIALWVADKPTKTIDIQYTGIEKMQEISTWASTDEVKKISVQITTSQTGGTTDTGSDQIVGNSGKDALKGENIWKGNPFEKTAQQWLDYFNKNSSPKIAADFLTQLVEDIKGASKGGSYNKAELGLSDVTNFKEDETFKILVGHELAQSVNGALSSEAIARLKKSFPGVTASDIISVIKWNEWTTEQQTNILNSIKKSFGSSETMKAAKENGVDISKHLAEGISSEEKKTLIPAGNSAADAVISGVKDKKVQITQTGAFVSTTIVAGIKGEEKNVKSTGSTVADYVITGIKNKVKDLTDAGVFMATKAIEGINSKKKDISDAAKAVADNVVSSMKEKEDDIKKAAQSWAKLISEQLAGDQSITVSADSTSVTNMTNGIKSSVEALTPEITVKAKFYSDEKTTYPGKLKSDIEALAPTITVKTKFADNALVNINNNITALSPVVEADVKVKDVTEFGKAIKQSIVDALKTIKFEVQDDGTLKVTAKAQGGLVKSGDLFIANENGKSEMIGRFGSNTAVANQEQMVEAMARGVQYANAEQNDLLRRQNEILIGILHKEGNVRLGASSALGRTISQSLEMYKMATGV